MHIACVCRVSVYMCIYVYICDFVYEFLYLHTFKFACYFEPESKRGSSAQREKSVDHNDEMRALRRAMVIYCR